MTTDATNSPYLHSRGGDEAPATPADWDAAMRALQEADAAYDLYRDEVWNPLEEKHEAWMIEQGASVAGADRVALMARHPLRDDWDRVNDHLEALAEAIADAEGVMMAMPAPSGAALRWKLDKLICDGRDDGPRESTPCWSADYVRQTVADFRRILGDA